MLLQKLLDVVKGKTGMRKTCETFDCHLTFPKCKSGTVALTLPSVLKGTKMNVTLLWAVSCVTLDEA